MFGIITPHPLNFLRTRESIPFGRLHASYKQSGGSRTALSGSLTNFVCVTNYKVHLDGDLPVTLVSLEGLGTLLYNVGLDQWLHHRD